MTSKSQEDRVERAIAAIADGDFVLVVDDEARENEGDLILAAEMATPEKLAFMVRHTSGLICAPVLGERLDELDLPLMVRDNTDSHKTAFTVSVDYTPSTTTGISAADRSATIVGLTSPDARAVDFTRPGHVFPLRYTDGGVLVRPGHTEAAVDLARLAGLYPAGALCEVVNDDGTMTRGDDLTEFATRHDLPMLSIEELIEYRWKNEALVERKVEARLPTRHGDFVAYGYRSVLDGAEHVALIHGDVSGRRGVPVRLHSECLTGDVFGSSRCDCGEQLDTALAHIATQEAGIVIYNRSHEGRGIGLMAKLEAYTLQDAGRDTVEANLELGFGADDRTYGVEAQIIADLKVGSVSVLTNNPHKVASLERLGVTVEGREALSIPPGSDNAAYLETKASKLGHSFS
ncbi:MAG: bifunctional 3,4-dihydroxy-2-butanone-4-phosphate synthase/GTP cyclohydrolase II [Acidimicrobiia bacterium]|nr:bifunctional 3,4-dihydroxy-2-butanone-4-phosphate synthase/GTP cyclohydrolase II [Acidimicrobiia bacterium]MBT8213759.1 bifunctional 3,4-dihydroxy-2-butanone-4-phosphate synthase/GTP cyclohydrolase II [Acidimicrobiia bacterium]